ncbi:hypothetical protein LOTGIDRAFT_172349 [Lottia gigantea]|uniref:Sushi domain-containing protein n=1 Tax=Lottia gigantea TaxID=225164 RepID=V4AWN2_LOTGI|nr:hypothetical protein LOTGIDRAFT_172349 [Lottia gigantea]ESP01883.1 hypothetical protein LOTGIDRAFT_172349 [Lottia gigantea]
MKGQIEGQVDIRSYQVRTEDGRVYRRNRKHLRSSNETFNPNSSENPPYFKPIDILNNPPANVDTQPQNTNVDVTNKPDIVHDNFDNAPYEIPIPDVNVSKHINSCGPPPNITSMLTVIPELIVSGSIVNYTCQFNRSITLTAVCDSKIQEWIYEDSVICPRKLLLLSIIPSQDQ